MDLVRYVGDIHRILPSRNLLPAHSPGSSNHEISVALGSYTATHQHPLGLSGLTEP